MKKFTAVLLSCVLVILSISNVALAAGGTSPAVTPRWINTTSLSGNINYDGYIGNISIFLDGNVNVTRITATARLYYMVTEDWWEEIPMNWDYDVTTTALGIDEDFPITTGTIYKIVFEAQVYANGYAETITRVFR
ncbi:MAG: hypothetical protein IJO74_00420 [Clostridia bacterium]|nr:hypothetical protein [Clostridia bacterium]